MNNNLMTAARSLTIAAAFSFAAAAAVAAETPSIMDALFNKSHLSNLAKGDTVTYNFNRESSEPKLMGINFSDTISLNVREVTDDGKRTVATRIFTGERDRGDRVIDGMTGNPVLVFFLDRAVSNFASLAGGSQAYHKNRFRIAMRTKGGLNPEKFEYNGKTVEGYRLAIRPFTGDVKNNEKMRGYENAHFEFLMSDDVPGYFAQFTSHYSSPLDGSPTLNESISADGVKITEVRNIADKTPQKAK